MGKQPCSGATAGDRVVWRRGRDHFASDRSMRLGDVQVVCPMNRGGLGACSLNIELQNALNQPGEVQVCCI
jgi:hypothetical protein